MNRIKRWWWFSVKNPVMRKGEGGGFLWTFRRFTLEIRTKSGNWSAKWTAAEHPYGYLISGSGDDNIRGFSQTMYQVGMLLTTEQRFVNDIQKALERYSDRLEKSAKVEDDAMEEKIALDGEAAVQEFIELPKKERRREERKIDRRFKKAVKDGKRG